MKYKTRPGVILIQICGEYLLISGAEARKYCPYSAQINETSAFLWKLLEQGASEKDMIQAIKEEYDTAELDVEAVVKEYLNHLSEKNYLVPEGELK